MISKTLFGVVIVLLSQNFFGAKADTTTNQTNQPQDGFGYELIQSKLDYLEFRFAELFIELKEQAEASQINNQRIQATQQQLNNLVEHHERKIVQLMEGLEESFGKNVSMISGQSRRILELQTVCSNHDLIRNSLFELRWKNGTTLKPQAEVPVCSELTSKTSGLCSMTIGEDEKMVVFMEQHRFGGNWMIVLQRFDGSVEFHRNWSDYRAGFGTVGQEFWVGLQHLHLLTKDVAYELLVEMEDFAGNYRYARYDRFAVGSEAELYSLKELGAFSGTAGDSLTSHKGSGFTTMDKAVHKTCVDSYTGGWWYIPPGMCYNTHLTGKWDRTNAWQSIVWKKFASPENTALKFARMMIRKK